MSNWSRLIPVVAGLIICMSVAATHAGSIENPAIASFDGGEISLQEIEIFAREMPTGQRVPFTTNAGEWRQFLSRELSKCIIFTTPALALGRHMDPAYLRGREYFLQEYLDFAMIRDNLLNKIDVSREAQEREFEAHRNDYIITPTVTLRYIRTKNADAATSAAARIGAGEEFGAVEREVSEVSPRYIGRVLGPYPDPKNRAGIPPPKAVLDAALETPIGGTTGPLAVGSNFFIARTEAKTTGGLAALSQVAEMVEARIRDREGERLRAELMAKLYQELDVKRDDALLVRKTGIRRDDVLATVGATLISRQEFEDLNGRVRGPALPISQHEPTRLAQFITPVILAEGARVRGYLNREETKHALYYWDIQHLSEWYISRQVEAQFKEPTDRELRMRFAAKYEELKAESRLSTPTFEMFRDHIAEAMRLERRPMVEDQVIADELRKRNWRTTVKQPVLMLSALEALVNAKDKLPADARVLEIAEAGDHPVQGHNWSLTAGRNQQWRITYTTPAGGASEFISRGPGLLSDGSTEFTSCPLYAPCLPIWRFDTDALFRHAVDKGIGDFAARYNNAVRLNSRVEIAYSEDVPTSPTDCLVTFTATPLDESAHDGFILKYSGITGDITQRRIGEPEGPCPTCPGPDLPSTAILKAAQGQTTATRSGETTAGISAAK